MTDSTDNPSPSAEDDIKNVLQNTLFQQVQTLLNYTKTESFALQIPDTQVHIFVGPRHRISELLGLAAVEHTNGDIVQDVLELFGASGFEIRPDNPQFAVVGSIDAAGILVDAVLAHCAASDVPPVSANTSAYLDRLERQAAEGEISAPTLFTKMRHLISAKPVAPTASIPPLTAPAPLTDATLLSEILALAEQGVSYGLLADDLCSQIVAKIKAAPAPQQSELSDAVKTWPERIWLQYGESEPETYPGAGSEITWCEDNINGAGDIEYVRADIAKAAPAAPVQTAEPYAYEEDNGADTELIYAAWFANGMGKMDPDCIYRPLYLQAEQAQAEPSDDDKYAVIVDRRDLFDFLRAAWRAGQDFFGPMTEQERWERSTNYANAEIKGWSTMRALPAQAEQEAAVRAAYENAAKLIDTKVYNYQDECGSYDHTTGVTEYPGNGAEWICEMEELAEEIRALAAPSTTPSNDTSAQGDTGGAK